MLKYFKIRNNKRVFTICPYTTLYWRHRAPQPNKKIKGINNRKKKRPVIYKFNTFLSEIQKKLKLVELIKELNKKSIFKNHLNF